VAILNGIDYNTYISSDTWRAKREKYFNSNMPQVCFACNAPKNKGFHIHHKTYKRFGNEKINDLVLLCPKCHKECHKFHKLDSTPKALWYATNGFIRKSREKLGLSLDIFRTEHPKRKKNK
jgi:5-methylcytosine-specific restriction endonuclease McrA